MRWIVGVVVLTSRAHIDENVDGILRNYCNVRHALGYVSDVAATHEESLSEC